MDGPQTISDYQNLLTEVIKKQIALLGAEIALSRVKAVPGITVADDGTVTAITGNPKETLQKVIEEFFVFSGLIVRKTMESILQSYPQMAPSIEKKAEEAEAAQTQPQPSQSQTQSGA